MGTSHFFGCFSVADWISAIERIDNWSLKICHLSCKDHRHDAPATLRAIVAVCGPHRQGGGRAARDPRGRHVASQIVRSGVAAAPNYDEARSGESRADFVHKVNVALKELVETRGWLKFIILAGLLPAKRVAVLVEECDQLCRILGKSIATAKAGNKQPLGDVSSDSR